MERYFVMGYDANVDRFILLKSDYFESYEDWCERRREEDIEAQRQNAIDDMYDDY